METDIETKIDQYIWWPVDQAIAHSVRPHEERDDLVFLWIDYSQPEGGAFVNGLLKTLGDRGWVMKIERLVLHMFGHEYSVQELRWDFSGRDLEFGLSLKYLGRLVQ